MKKITKLLALLLAGTFCGLFAVSAVGCKEKDDSESVGSVSSEEEETSESISKEETVVWTATGSEKFLRATD